MTPCDTVAAGALVVLERLRRALDASRTTLRIDHDGLGFHMDDVAAEALAEGEATMRGEGTIRHRAAPTGLWLERNRRLLVQDDVTATEFPPPPALVQVFGVRAQMLAPLIAEGRLDGWLSVHEAKRIRRWSEAEQAAAEDAAAEIQRLVAAVSTLPPV